MLLEKWRAHEGLCARAEAAREGESERACVLLRIKSTAATVSESRSRVVYTPVKRTRLTRTRTRTRGRERRPDRTRAHDSNPSADTEL